MENKESSDEENLSQENEIKNKDDEVGSNADFKQLKLATKHAAFLRHREDEGWFLHYSTQNERC